MITNDKPLVKRESITKSDAGYAETKEQKFERFLRQISKCIYSCSLCELGDNEVFHNNTYYDPHYSNNFKFNKIVFLKFSPTEHDVANGLFNDCKPTCDKIGVKLDSIYKTTIQKCYGESKYRCPYFDMEMEASKDLFKLIILFDKRSADYLGIEFIIGKLNRHDNYRTYCCDGFNLEQILKLIKLSETNLQIRNSLFA